MKDGSRKEERSKKWNEEISRICVKYLHNRVKAGQNITWNTHSQQFRQQFQLSQQINQSRPPVIKRNPNYNNQHKTHHVNENKYHDNFEFKKYYTANNQFSSFEECQTGKFFPR